MMVIVYRRNWYRFLNENYIDCKDCFIKKKKAIFILKINVFVRNFAIYIILCYIGGTRLDIFNRNRYYKIISTEIIKKQSRLSLVLTQSMFVQ